MNLPKLHAVHRVALTTPETTDSAACTLVDALRAFMRETVRGELAGFKEDLLLAIRRAPGAGAVEHASAGARLLSVAEVAERLGSTPATVREWIKDGYLPAVALGPAGRRYAIRWVDVEASLTMRKSQTNSMDMDAEASQIVGAARSRAARRKGA
jgi:excisionase family DNA binding protein